MKHATPIRRLALVQVLALTIVSDACAQQQPQSARDTLSHAYTCYELSYAPDTLSYYLPAVVQLVEGGASTPRASRSHVARWRGGIVQRQDLHSAYKLSNGAAVWRQRGDSLVIEMDPVLASFTMRLRRADSVAQTASRARSSPITWHGRAFAYLGDGPTHLEGDVFMSATACDAFRTPR